MGSMEEWRWQERISQNEDRATEITHSEQQRKKNKLKKMRVLVALETLAKDLKLMSSESQKAEKKCGPEMFPIGQKTQA